MSIFHSMNTTASALTAQRLRMDIVSSNMANRIQHVLSWWMVNGMPYRRKTVVMEPKESQFSSFLQVAMNLVSDQGVGNGVKVTKIIRR